MRFIMLLHADDGWFGSADPHRSTDDHEGPLANYQRALSRAGVLLGAERVVNEPRGFRMMVEPHRELPLTTTLRAVWFVELRSREEAVEWARRCPLPSPRMHVQVHQVR